MSAYNIVQLSPGASVPFHLLLLADETITAIERYIYQSDIYVAYEHSKDDPIAVCALYRIDDTTVEIKNIAVAENIQSKGTGSFLIDKIKSIAKEKHYKTIIVGTPSTGQREINFYERNGFVKYDVKKDFFIINYPEPIYNEGVLLKDMVMLKYEL